VLFRRARDEIGENSRQVPRDGGDDAEGDVGELTARFYCKSGGASLTFSGPICERMGFGPIYGGCGYPVNPSHTYAYVLASPDNGYSFNESSIKLSDLFAAQMLPLRFWARKFQRFTIRWMPYKETNSAFTKASRSHPR
jgi:hypothetical protein